eukprot:m.42166 g.42166  ORF g.42166 m.42166 type:complete len:273 (-) comp16962_c0_seq3:6-824(-)
MLLMVRDLSRQVEELKSIISGKDREIAEYKQAGVSAARFATDPFDPNMFKSEMSKNMKVDDAENDETIDVFTPSLETLYMELMGKLHKQAVPKPAIPRKSSSVLSEEAFTVPELPHIDSNLSQEDLTTFNPSGMLLKDLPTTLDERPSDISHPTPSFGVDVGPEASHHKPSASVATDIGHNPHNNNNNNNTNNDNTLLPPTPMGSLAVPSQQTTDGSSLGSTPSSTPSKKKATEESKEQAFKRRKRELDEKLAKEKEKKAAKSKKKKKKGLL